MLRWGLTALSLAVVLVSCEESRRPAMDRVTGRIDDGPFSSYSRFAWDEARAIPDGDRRGILIGPVLTKDGPAEVGPLILRMAVSHPAPGDLDVWLAYDGDDDGNPEVRAPVEFFHSRHHIWAEEGHACPVSLEGTYLFRDGAGWEDAIFAPFLSQRRGRGFYLQVADTLAGVSGSVLGWAVYLEEVEPTVGR